MSAIAAAHGNYASFMLSFQPLKCKLFHYFWSFYCRFSLSKTNLRGKVVSQRRSLSSMVHSLILKRETSLFFSDLDTVLVFTECLHRSNFCYVGKLISLFVTQA